MIKGLHEFEAGGTLFQATTLPSLFVIKIRKALKARGHVRPVHIQGTLARKPRRNARQMNIQDTSAHMVRRHRGHVGNCI